MQLDELSAREEIRDAVSRLAVLGDRGLVDDMMPLYAADATLDIKGKPPVKGREEIRKFFLGVASPSESSPSPRVGTAPSLVSPGDRPKIARHLVTNTTIDLIGSDRAEVTSYFTIVTPRGVSSVGRWFDTFAVGDGRWQLTKRVVRHDMEENP